MSNEIIQRLTTEVERRHAQALEEVDRQVELGTARMSGLGQLTRAAIREALKTNLMTSGVEQYDPDHAQVYATMAAIGNAELAEQIRLQRRSS